MSLIDAAVNVSFVVAICFMVVVALFDKGDRLAGRFVLTWVAGLVLLTLCFWALSNQASWSWTA